MMICIHVVGGLYYEIVTELRNLTMEVLSDLGPCAWNLGSLEFIFY